MARINDSTITDSTVLSAVKYIKAGTETREIESMGILIADNAAPGDRSGSTNVVSVNSGTNVNLVSDKNILFKAKKAKLVFDTTNSAKAGNGNEMQIISKIKENVSDADKGYYRTEVDDVYCGDHGDIIMEQRRLRIKPFNVPKWTSTAPALPTIAQVKAAELTEGYVYLDTAGLEDTDAGGAGFPTVASNESTFEVRVGNNATSTSTLATAEYRPLTIKTRGIDLRCMTHSGIALQPCGYDEPNSTTHHENKIKFESSRIKDIYADDVKTDTNGNLYIDNSKGGYIYTDGTKEKWVRGGDGLEFGTFNNLHSSLFTRDYRFNAEGVVYAVGRKILYEDADKAKYELQSDGYHKIVDGVVSTTVSTPTIVKADYVTQTDDTKDIISSDTDKAALVKDIVKTAYSLNGGKNRHTKITSSGALEIETNKTFHWVEITGTPGELSVIPSALANLTAIYNSGDLPETAPSVGSVYQSGGKLYQWTEIESPEIVISSGSDITLQSSGDDIVLDAADVVKLSGKEIRLTANHVVDNVDKGFISLSTTPKIVCLSLKFKKSATFEANNTIICTGFLNNTSGTIYKTSTGAVKVPTETIYSDATCVTPITTGTTEGTAIWHKVNNLPVPCDNDSKYFMMIEGVPYQIATKSKSPVVKKNGITVCNETSNPNVTFVASTYTPSTGEVAIPAGEIAEGTESCSVADLITLVNYFKTNNQGPWAND